MTKQEIAEQVLKETGGIARTAQFIAAGLSRGDVCHLNNSGVLDRVRTGYYRRGGNRSLNPAQYLEALVPEGILAVESALYCHGYITEPPQKLNIAVPRSISQAKLRKQGILEVLPFYVQEEQLPIGRIEMTVGGVQLPVYDKERTVCDCLKYHTHMDQEAFKAAIRHYVTDPKRNIPKLRDYAEKLGVLTMVDRMLAIMLPRAEAGEI